MTETDTGWFRLGLMLGKKGFASPTVRVGAGEEWMNLLAPGGNPLLYSRGPRAVKLHLEV